jgi:hypothetical protein
MESDDTADTAGVPEPTNALFLPTTAVPNESSNLAWSTDDHTVGPEPFGPEPFEPPRRFDWVGWMGPVLLAIAAVIAAIWMLNSLLNYMHQSRVGLSDGTTQQTPTWREPAWLPLLSAPSPRPVPSITP